MKKQKTYWWVGTNWDTPTTFRNEKGNRGFIGPFENAKEARKELKEIEKQLRDNAKEDNEAFNIKNFKENWWITKQKDID